MNLGTLVLGTTHFNRTSHPSTKLQTSWFGNSTYRTLIYVSSGPGPVADDIINMVIFIKQINTFEKM